MSAMLKPVITQAGITALIDAKNRGIHAQITHVAVGNGATDSQQPETAGPYTATPEMTALKNEIQRSPVSGGELLGHQQNQLHLTATIRDGGTSELAARDNFKVYAIYEIGFFLADGTLFAVYASPGEKLAEKVNGTDFVLAFDLTLTGIEAGNIQVDGSGQLQMPLARDNLLVGENTIKIHNQAEFDNLFNQGDDTVIPANTTVIFSPRQTDDSAQEAVTTGYNQRPAYVLKNSILLGSHVAILGFNPDDTLVVKNHGDITIKLLGSAAEPVAGVALTGWTFDGRGGVNGLGGTLTASGNGGAFYLQHATDCRLDCKIINHACAGKGGGIFAADGVTRIIAQHIYHNRAHTGGGVYGAQQSTLTVYDCLAETAGSGVANAQRSHIRTTNCALENCTFSQTVCNTDGDSHWGVTGLHIGGHQNPGANNLRVDGNVTIGTPPNAAHIPNTVNLAAAPSGTFTASTFTASRNPSLIAIPTTFSVPTTSVPNGTPPTSLSPVEPATPVQLTVHGSSSVRGWLGIGDAAPLAPVYIKASTGGKPVSINQNHFAGNAAMELATSDATGQQATRLCLRGGADQTDIEFLRGARGTEEPMAIFKGGSGNLGIGTTTPSATLDVAGKINTTGGLTVDSEKPFIYKEYKNKGDNANFNTGMSTSNYVATITGFAGLNGDINEKGSVHIIRIYAYQKSETQTWWVRADFASHSGANENWNVNVMFINKKLVDM